MCIGVGKCTQAVINLTVFGDEDVSDVTLVPYKEKNSEGFRWSIYYNGSSLGLACKVYVVSKLSNTRSKKEQG